MRIAVFLTSGSRHDFEQPDAQLAKENRGRFWPDEVFAGPTVSVAGDAYWTAFRSSTVTRIELTHDEMPDWPQNQNIDSITLLSEADFTSRRAELATPLEGAAAGQDFTAFAELEDSTGTIHYVEVHGKTLAEVARPRGLERLLESPCVVAARGEDTAVLINPANLVAVRVSGAGPVTARTIRANRA
ncbi:MAG: hypothetical protein QNJ98_09495 [Planctomycetota bacterium]|nr:hypothetical protein [Planctomycetota bacterium]